eukprot:m.100368 g.100368  ORF g.100368 m.100368 type:complete len:572 (-) comp15623_c0_seq1:377-2092(-)
MRTRPVTHATAGLPVCEACRNVNAELYNGRCMDCEAKRGSQEVDIDGLFAVLRQWDRSTNVEIEKFIREILLKGAHVNDVDSTTGMSLLHYAAKNGARGMGDAKAAASAVALLLDKGANADARCMLDMTPLHYATYFGNLPVITELLRARPGLTKTNINASTSEYAHATSLHLACMEGRCEALQLLLNNGANASIVDAHGQTPLQFAYKLLRNPSTHLPEETIREEIAILERYLGLAPGAGDEQASHAAVVSRSVANIVKGEPEEGDDDVHTDVHVGDRVLYEGRDKGTVTYVGRAAFQPGTTYGVLLDQPNGFTDGRIDGVEYFRSRPEHGVFAKRRQLRKLGAPLKKKPSAKGSSSEDDPDALTVFSGGSNIAPFSAPTFRLTPGARSDNGQAAPPTVFTFAQERQRFVPTHTVPPATAPVLSPLKHEPSNVTSLRELGEPKRTPSPSVHKQHRQTATTDLFGLHSRVMVTHGEARGLIGVVKYIGSDPSRAGAEDEHQTVLGVELEAPIPSGNDGTVHGRRLFQCKSQHGCVVQASHATWHGRRVVDVLSDEHSSGLSPRTFSNASRA